MSSTAETELAKDAIISSFNKPLGRPEIGRPAFLFFFFFFLYNIALAIQGLLSFHTNFKIFCSTYVKNVIDNLIGIALNL